MSLPFQTAGRAPDARSAAAGSPPHGAREGWRRPYRPGPLRVAGAAVLLLLASYVLLSTLIIAVAGGPLSACASLAVGVLLIGLALRLLRVGVWVSAQGLRRVGLLGTTTLAWAEVGAVRTRQQPVRWLGLPRTVQGQAVSVERAADGEPLRALVTDHSADFLGRREAFERAADVLEGWAAESRPG